MRTSIDELRQAHDLTWDELAQATGIGKPTLHKLAHNKSKSVRLEHLDALCSYFPRAGRGAADCRHCARAADA